MAFVFLYSSCGCWTGIPVNNVCFQGQLLSYLILSRVGHQCHKISLLEYNPIKRSKKNASALWQTLALHTTHPRGAHTISCNSLSWLISCLTRIKSFLDGIVGESSALGRLRLIPAHAFVCTVVSGCMPLWSRCCWWCWRSCGEVSGWRKRDQARWHQERDCCCCCSWGWF